MQQIRVPKTLTPNFKDFCKRFSHRLESTTSIRLRGNKLLNIMAQAAGHDHYKALLIDSGTYGDGSFDWDVLPMALAEPLAELLDVPAYQLWKPLMDAVLSEPATITEINEKMKHSHNPFAGIQIKDVALPTEQSQYGSLFSNSTSEIALLEVIRAQKSPVIDLHPVCSLNNPQDKMKLLRTIAHQFLDMDKALQDKVIFLGEKADIALLLQADLNASKALLENPSIITHGIKLTIASSDPDEFANASAAEIAVIHANTNTRIFIDQLPMPWPDKDLSRTLNLGRSYEAQRKEHFTFGESFAGRQRPLELVNCEPVIVSLVDAVKAEIEPVAHNRYDLQDFANGLYVKLSNTNGFSSLDLAGWLLDNGRMLELALSNLQKH